MESFKAPSFYPISCLWPLETITTVLTMWKTQEVPCHSKQWLTTIYKTCKHFTAPKSTPDDKIIIIMKLMETRRRTDLDHVCHYPWWGVIRKKSWERHKKWSKLIAPWKISQPPSPRDSSPTFFLETIFSISWHPSGQELVKKKRQCVRKAWCLFTEVRLPRSTGMCGRVGSNCEHIVACPWFLTLI